MRSRAHVRVGARLVDLELPYRQPVRLEQADERSGVQVAESSGTAAVQDRSKNVNEEMLEGVRAWFDQNLNMSWDEFFDIAVRSKGSLPVVVS